MIFNRFRFAFESMPPRNRSLSHTHHAIPISASSAVHAYHPAARVPAVRPRLPAAAVPVLLLQVHSLAPAQPAPAPGVCRSVCIRCRLSPIAICRTPPPRARPLFLHI
jgi:hypothetical protein